MSERVFSGQCDWPCICGHAKCLPDESHYFGDPPRGMPMHTACMVSGCDCRQFRPVTEEPTTVLSRPLPELQP